MNIEQRLEVLERKINEIFGASQSCRSEYKLRTGVNQGAGDAQSKRTFLSPLLVAVNVPAAGLQPTHDSDTKDDPATCLLNALVAFIRSEVKKTTPNEVAVDGAVDAILKKSLLAHTQLSEAIILYGKLVQDKFEQSRASSPC